MRLLLALLACGCSQRSDLLARSDGSIGCGAPIKLGDECAGAAAARRLRYALCSCAPLVLPHNLNSDGGGTWSAAIGTDKHVHVGGGVQVSGVVEAAGARGITIDHFSTVIGTLRSGGPLSINEALYVAGDAFVSGNVLGDINIEGILHVPPDAMISGSVHDNGEVYGAVEVKPPCNCDASPDLAALVANHAMVNDNNSINLASDALIGGRSALDLPCGEYWLSQVTTKEMELQLRVRGRTALYVNGDVYLGAGLRVMLDPMAELDLVVGGSLFADDGMVGASNPERVRIWVAGPTLDLGDYARLSASVYAPNAVVVANGVLDVNGALLAGGIQAFNNVRVHYAGEILGAGASCGEMPQPPVE
jgi:hypothetical protein